jgi:diguanylate cyclase (GGDEF)-like protein
MNNYRAVLDAINIGVVLLDTKLNVTGWNNWMTVYSGKQIDDVIGKNVIDVYPELNRKCFTRGCKSVMTFGNMVFLSSKLHKFLFPFKLAGSYSTIFENMQQSCYIVPMRNDDGEIDGIMVNVYDVTENAVLEKHLKELSYLDGLTGAYNRRTFEKRLEEEFTRHKRNNSALGLIMFDLDHFKAVNDNCGHQFGDVVLQQVIKTCTKNLRTEDFIARYGGEEFVCLLVNQNLEQSYMVAERLRKSVAETVIDDGNLSMKCTISLGVADSVMCQSPEELLKAADKALYAAKAAGRNRTHQA